MKRRIFYGETPYNTTIYNTALYLRLSRDDESYGDSVSIETQRDNPATNTQKNMGFMWSVSMWDDGWSGTNFERPNFQRMMDDVDAGKSELYCYERPIQIW